MDHKFKSSKWENNKFIFAQKDCSYQYQGLTWPRRNYTCNFCHKEYKSAQALGGHMNVHRRDRARLRLSSPPLENPNPNPDPDPNPNPNPKYVSPPSPVRYLSYKNYHSTLFPPFVSTTKANDEQHELSLFAYSGIDFLGCMAMEDGGGEEENVIRVLKKNEVLNMEMDLDLELRLGRS